MIIAFSFILFVITLFVFLIEIKKRKWQFKALKKIKNIILILCIINLLSNQHININNNLFFIETLIVFLDVSLHYTVYVLKQTIYSIIFVEAMWFFCVFLICFYISKKATDILPSRTRWLRFLKIFLLVNLIWFIVALIILSQ